MEIQLRPLTQDDVAAHLAGEDDATVRWLSGGRGTPERTSAFVRQFAENARLGTGKRGYGVWLEGRLAGYVEADPDCRDGLAEGDVNLAYAVHPWARGRGVAGAAVDELCTMVQRLGLGTRAAIRVEPENTASVRVAEKLGFEPVREFVSTTDTDEEGYAVTLRLYVREL